MGSPRARRPIVDQRIWATVSAALLALSASSLVADVWDQGDGTAATTNELIHGSEQLHDLAARPGPAADEDWFVLLQQPYSSYEIVIDGASGALASGAGLDLTRRTDAGIQLQSSSATGAGPARSLRWQNLLATAVGSERIRVRSAGCTTTCTTADSYRIRAWDTTYTVPRFNNAGSQVTVLVVQNPTSEAVQGTAWFWNVAGTLLGSHPFTLAPGATLVLPTASVSGVSGQSGTITVSNDAPYGALAGKAVALDAASGLSFDTPMAARAAASSACQAGGTGANCTAAASCIGTACCTGLCRDLGTDLGNCGQCGLQCTNPHGSTACVSALCAPTCASGWQSCDGNLSNGCESNRNTNPGCPGTALGSVRGDVGSDVLTTSAYGEAFYSVHIPEANNSSLYLSAQVTLQSPPGVDFDLCVSCAGCGGTTMCSIAGTAGQSDTVWLKNDDNVFGDDTFDAVIEIRYYSGTMTACSNWALTVTGNVVASPPYLTCGP